jgi:hypothetical protein
LRRGSSRGWSPQNATEAFGTNRAYVAEAKRLKQEAPKTFAAVKAGKKNMRQVITGRRHREAHAKDKALTRRATGRAEIRQQDADSFLCGLASASADLRLTDPPYQTEVDDMAASAEPRLITARTDLGWLMVVTEG